MQKPCSVKDKLNFSTFRLCLHLKRVNFFHTFQMCAAMHVGLSVKCLQSDFNQSWNKPHFCKLPTTIFHVNIIISFWVFYILRYRYAICNNLCLTPENASKVCAEQNVKMMDDTRYLEEFSQFIYSLIETHYMKISLHLLPDQSELKTGKHNI